MIHVDRNRIERPLVLDMERGPAGKELHEANDFFHQTDRNRQRRFEFKVYRHSSVKEALTRLFHGKCAYCEAKIVSGGPLDVELFRPKAGVLESPPHPGYWWLAMAWENMLASCVDCNRIRTHEGVRTGKANRFPLEDETKRAFQPGDQDNEQPLLLDPCNDHPEQHLVFDEAGIVVSDTTRGKTTIAVLGLNRPFLVDARHEAAQRTAHHIKLLKQLPDTKSRLDQLKAIQRMTEPQEEFAGLKRQLIGSLLEKYKSVFEQTGSTVLPGTKVSTARKRRAKAEYSAFEREQSDYSLNDEDGRKKYRGQRRIIERIIIDDVKAIRTLDLDLTSQSGRTPWLMLLGENATGKSTVLQTTALALLGARAFVQLANASEVHPANFIRFKRKRGSVSVKLSGFPKPHKLEFHPDRVEFTSPTSEKTSVVFENGNPRIEGTGWGPQTLLLGYGATKLLPRGASKGGDSVVVDSFCRVDNLFDPFVPLIHAEQWLLGLDAGRFDDTAIILKDLMSLTETTTLIRENGRVMVVEPHSSVPLLQLSDGYQSVLAMTADILEVALRLWPSLMEAEGIVLLDEVGAHLHPTWKMKIVGSLRKALPAMQFLATTHDPLCLRGLGKGEVAVMRRGEDHQVTALTQLPSPNDFRIDQLLTSDFFGLDSTIDPDVEAVFDEYYALKALPSRDDPQNTRLSELQEQLKDRRYLGNTMRESLMFEAVDKLMAQRRKEPSIPLVELKQAAVDEVSKIWNEPALDGKDGIQ